MGIIRKFIAERRRKASERRMEREISKIFSHLRQEADHGYPFKSDEELATSQVRGFYDASKAMEAVYRAAAKMPPAKGHAFRYIAARELNERLAMYLKFAQEQEYPADCDPRLVARAI